MPVTLSLTATDGRQRAREPSHITTPTPTQPPPSSALPVSQASTQTSPPPPPSPSPPAEARAVAAAAAAAAAAGSAPRSLCCRRWRRQRTGLVVELDSPAASPKPSLSAAPSWVSSMHMQLLPSLTATCNHQHSRHRLQHRRPLLPKLVHSPATAPLSPPPPALLRSMLVLPSLTAAEDRSRSSTAQPHHDTDTDTDTPLPASVPIDACDAVADGHRRPAESSRAQPHHDTDTDTTTAVVGSARLPSIDTDVTTASAIAVTSCRSSCSRRCRRRRCSRRLCSSKLVLPSLATAEDRTGRRARQPSCIAEAITICSAILGVVDAHAIAAVADGHLQPSTLTPPPPASPSPPAEARAFASNGTAVTAAASSAPIDACAAVVDSGRGQVTELDSPATSRHRYRHRHTTASVSSDRCL